MPHRTSQDGTDRSQGVLEDLIEMIDSHLATQLDAAQHERPTSAGTMFVDWDGTGEPKITYRNREDSAQCSSDTDPARHDSVPFNTALALKPLPPLPSRTNKKKTSTSNQKNFPVTANSERTTPVARLSSRANPHHHKHLSSSRNLTPSNTSQLTSSDGLQITYRQPRPSKSSSILRPAFVAGYDPSTHYTYDYNGRIMHIHRDELHREGEERLSICSEYYAVDAEEYNPNVPLLVEPPAQTPMEQKKRDRVVGFVQRLLRGLEGLGIMRRLREERRRLRCGGR